LIEHLGVVMAGTSVAVFGTGGIGASAIIAAASLGSSPLIAVDVHPERLQLAERVGATHAVNAAFADPVEEIRTITGGQGVDVAVELAGRVESMEAAVRVTRPRGGICVLGGNLAARQRITIDPMDLIEGRTLRGTWGGETVPDRDIPEYAARYLRGEFDITALLGDCYPLELVNDAVSDLAKGKAGRPLLSMRADGKA
jgi:S-(hydroxymethyl)glutathione dehydrogenase/alcohol dehydrogenase